MVKVLPLKVYPFTFNMALGVRMSISVEMHNDMLIKLKLTVMIKLEF